MERHTYHQLPTLTAQIQAVLLIRLSWRGAGIEPGSLWFLVRCPTDWAKPAPYIHWYNFHLFYSLSARLMSMWYTRTVVLIWSRPWKNSLFSLSVRSDFHPDIKKQKELWTKKMSRTYFPQKSDIYDYLTIGLNLKMYHINTGKMQDLKLIRPSNWQLILPSWWQVEILTGTKRSHVIIILKKKKKKKKKKKWRGKEQVSGHFQ